MLLTLHPSIEDSINDPLDIFWYRTVMCKHLTLRSILQVSQLFSTLNIITDFNAQLTHYRHLNTEACNGYKMFTGTEMVLLFVATHTIPMGAQI